jgi:predicted DNA-binding transcriptional regulator YafY
MGQIKNAIIRYRLIDKCIQNKYAPFPSKIKLREVCEEHLFGSEGENISDSTIEKDLYAMRMDHDAPIKFSKKNNGYYYADENFSMNDIPLTEDDLEAIRFAASTLSQFKDNPFMQQFGSAIDKISDRVSLTNPATEAGNYIQFEASTTVRGSEYLAILLEAMQSGKKVTFDYESFVSGNRKARTCSPYLLKEYLNRWYLVCFDDEKGFIITYALERMFEPEISEAAADNHTNFDRNIYFAHSIGITAGGKAPEQVLLKVDNISSKYLETQPLHHTQEVVKRGKNKTTFQLNVVQSEELIRALLAYGGDLEISEPVSLRNEIVARIAKMRLNYEK